MANKKISKANKKKKLMKYAGIAAILLAGLKASSVLLKNKSTEIKTSDATGFNDSKPEIKAHTSVVETNIKPINKTIQDKSKMRKTYYYIEVPSSGNSKIKQRAYKYV